MLNIEKINELNEAYAVDNKKIIDYYKMIKEETANKDYEEEDIYVCLEKVVSMHSSQKEGTRLPMTKKFTDEEMVNMAIEETFIPYSLDSVEYIEDDEAKLFHETSKGLSLIKKINKRLREI